MTQAVAVLGEGALAHGLGRGLIANCTNQRKVLVAGRVRFVRDGRRGCPGASDARRTEQLRDAFTRLTEPPAASGPLEGPDAGDTGRDTRHGSGGDPALVAHPYVRAQWPSAEIVLANGVAGVAGTNGSQRSARRAATAGIVVYSMSESGKR